MGFFFGPSGGYSYRPCRAVNFLCHTQTKLTDKQPTFEVTKQSVIYDRVNYTWNICINQFWKWQNGMTVWERRTDTTYEQQGPKEKTTHTKKYDQWAAEHWNQNITHHTFFYRMLFWCIFDSQRCAPSLSFSVMYIYKYVHIYASIWLALSE